MRFDRLKRREFITLVGGAVTWPLAARAQQPAMPVIGFLDIRSSDAAMGDRLRAFRQGLKDTGYVEGENVTITYSWADNQIDRLPALVAELVRRPVAVIAASGGVEGVLAAKAASATIPIVFLAPQDPVKLGLVASLARPGGNLNILNAELVAKQLELMRELVPRSARVTVLVNPNNPTSIESALGAVEVAARTLGLQIEVLRAATSPEIESAFATFAQARPDALLVNQDGFFAGRRVQLVQQAAYHRVPAVYSTRDFTEAGGLMSYGTSITDAYRQLGVYAGRILKGAKPADLPVVQATKFELVINHPTARMLGLTVPPSLLATADEVIE
jgi:putative ABC transport system substrate-binding protein